MNTLLINACVREDSRTRRLAEDVLRRLGGTVTEVELEREQIPPLFRETLAARSEKAERGAFGDPVFRYARQFAQADVLLFAAPYWDLSFPACLKAYLEAINVAGITFRYSEQGIPESLCRASRMIYVTTAGGYILSDEPGYGYVKLLCETFYGVRDALCVKAEGLDLVGADPEAILCGRAAALDRLL